MAVFAHAFSYMQSVRRAWRIALLSCVGVVFVAFTLTLLILPPKTFPLGSVVEVEDGTTLAHIADDMAERHVVRSSLVLRALVALLGGDAHVHAGDYFFKKPRTAFTVAHMLTSGYFGAEPVRVLIPEGTSSYEIAQILEKHFPTFATTTFITLASEQEGYLFPDTYFFLPMVRPSEVVRVMTENFHTKTTDLKKEVVEKGHELDTIVVMASLLEKEANRFEVRRKIAGILWNRLAIGMPLQVDATFLYINGKNTYELTHADLNIDSPYNTYEYKGLPPTAITNPSLEALRAALEPTDSDYLFYLADRRGNTYYAEDFDGHKENRVLYLGK
jgi:UPF0755 protein